MPKRRKPPLVARIVGVLVTRAQVATDTHAQVIRDRSVLPAGDADVVLSADPVLRAEIDIEPQRMELRLRGIGRQQQHDTKPSRAHDPCFE